MRRAPARQRGVDARRLGGHQLRCAAAGARLGLHRLQLEPHLGRKALGVLGECGVGPRRHARADGDQNELHRPPSPAASPLPLSAWRSSSWPARGAPRRRAAPSLPALLTPTVRTTRRAGGAVARDRALGGFRRRRRARRAPDRLALGVAGGTPGAMALGFARHRRGLHQARRRRGADLHPHRLVAPELLEVVVLADRGLHDVDDGGAAVDDDPFAVVFAFGARRRLAGRFHRIANAGCQRPRLPVARPRRDDHAFEERRQMLGIEDNDVLGLDVFQTIDDDALQLANVHSAPGEVSSGRDDGAQYSSRPRRERDRQSTRPPPPVAEPRSTRHPSWAGSPSGAAPWRCWR